jgi:hypothetical protein
MAYRAGINYWIAGLQLLNSWDFPITLSGLYDSNGKLIYSKELLVAELNKSFAPKATNSLAQAEVAFTAGLTHALAIFEKMGDVSVDGVIEMEPDVTSDYAELKAMVTHAQSALGGSQIIPYISPEMSANLKVFFQSPPTPESDPFVLEDGSIQWVESYFDTLLKDMLTIDFGQAYQISFGPNHYFLYKVFNEFTKWNVAGLVTGKFGVSSASSSSSN